MTLVVLCGQPRSGTSMMMRILKEGGIEVEFDNRIDQAIRKEIFRNPYGFFEMPNPTFTKCFKCWHPNMATKIPINAKVIFIQRDIEKMVKSWKDIQSKRPGPKIDEQRMRDRIKSNRDLFELTLQDKDVLKLDYDTVVNDSENELTKIANFLDVPFDKIKAKEAIDKGLYKNR